MLNNKITPPVPKGYSTVLIAHVHTGSISMRRAMRYANELRTEINGGVEIFTGWCQFLEGGTRVGALADNHGPITRGIPMYNGWVVGHQALGLSAFVTIGDVIVAWAELPVCDIRE